MRDSVAPQTATTSVLIPTYNMAEFLPDAVRSVLHGSYHKVEVIVVDDGSSDETRSVMKYFVDETCPGHDSRVTYIRQENAGKPVAVNRALEAATGARIAFLDADDVLTPGALALLNRRLDEEGSTEMVVGGFEVFDKSTSYGSRLPPQAPSAESLRRSFYLRWRTPFHLNASLLRRRLVERVGPMDERLARCIDGDYALRLLGSTRGISSVDEVVYRYRKHRSSAYERIKYRLQTARYRPLVIYKNYSGFRRYWGILFGIGLDAAKLAYEVISPYRS